MIRLFRHYIPLSLLLLGSFEFVVLFAAVYLGVNLRFSGVPGAELSSVSLVYKALVFAVTNMLVLFAIGLYQRGLRDTFKDTLIRILAALVVGVVAMMLLFYVFPSLFIGRGAFGLAVVVGFLGVTGCRSLFLRLVDHHLLNERVLVVGTGKSANELAMMRRKSDWRGISLAGFYHVRGEHDVVEATRIVGRELSLFDTVKQYGIDELVVAILDTRKSFPFDDILACKMAGVRVTELADFFERRTGKIQLDVTTPNKMIFLDGFDRSPLSAGLKRLFDLLTSLGMLLATLPIMLVTALAIWLESGFRGPIFYSQERVGQRGEVFLVHKFRSMIVDAEKNGAQWAAKNDARVTRVGGFIRKTRIDELPQLYNVWRGDMSFVGPRPERPPFVEQLEEAIPYYALRHRVKPGITGWAQICYPYGDSIEDAKSKLQFDLYYIKNYSLFLDLTILFQTAQVVIWNKGAR
ncbi:MAG: TIGR03013 family PEP-CTERM/XrtA system glycosyltransferase [Gammaproteobacteria bacterium]|nr:TIGR03013 family PEP-CTERM/XrtA system glycosyltransferase [Gammaproteobacteria bacterium]